MSEDLTALRERAHSGHWSFDDLLGWYADARARIAELERLRAADLETLVATYERMEKENDRLEEELKKLKLHD